jgi:20S proteasome subunit alpha 5
MYCHSLALSISCWYCHVLPVFCRYHTDPSGTYVKYRCMAIGSGSEGAQTALQEHYKDDITLAEAEVLALTTLKQVMEEKVKGGGGGKGGGYSVLWCCQARHSGRS